MKDRVQEKLAGIKREHELVQRLLRPGRSKDWSGEEAAIVSKWKVAAETRLGILSE